MFTRMALLSKSWIGFILLLGLAYLGNRINLSLFFGLDFLFGSIFVWLIVKRYGIVWGLAASVIASSHTLILWNHPYAMIVFIIETLFVSLLYRQKLTNLVLSAALFWVFLGMPVIGLTYHYFLNMNATATWMAMLKDAMNGIFNALVASLILTYLPMSQRSGLSAVKSSASLYDILFNIFVAFIVFPTLVVLILVGRENFNKINKEVQTSAELQSEIIAEDIQNWKDAHMDAVIQMSKLASEIGLKKADTLQQYAAFFKQTFPDFQSTYIADSTGTTLAFYPLFNESGQSTLGLNFADRPYFKEIKANFKPFVSGVFAARGSVYKPIVLIGAPCILNQRFQGIAVGSINLDYINDKIKMLTSKTHMNVTLVDSSNLVIASTRSSDAVMEPYNWQKGGELRSLGKDFYQWTPKDVKNPMIRWEKSSYVKTVEIAGQSDWTLIVEAPVAPYREILYVSYIKILTILLICGLLAILTSIIISRLLLKPIARLTDTTTDLPAKMLDKYPLHWPVSFISEIAALINNFKGTAEKLQKMFHEIQHLAYYDNLTGLPNRLLFNQQLETILENTKMTGLTTAVLFIDLDRFKVINDTLGHGNGDLLLQNAAERLKRCFGSGDVLSRMGGDEFIAVLPNRTREQTEAAAQAMLDVFATVIPIHGHEVFITPSIGISLYPDDGSDPQALIKNADQAMYSAKEKGKNRYQFYTYEMDQSSANKMILETMMHKAIDNNEFELYYQPKVNLLRGTLTGLEALIRWRHPDRGWISPAEFIPVAEETGMINRIGEWVLRTACAQMKAWQTAGYIPVCVSVNLSVRQFKEQNLISLLSSVLRETGLDPQYLELEITENISMHNMDFVLAVLHDIKRLGVKISMDDFGTGYSSLSYLKKFPIDQLKIDQSFVRDIQNNPEDDSIVKAIISMAHSLGLSVIAEGVETEAQSALLRGMKCNEIQGYLISKPLPKGQIEQFLGMA